MEKLPTVPTLTQRESPASSSSSSRPLSLFVPALPSLFNALSLSQLTLLVNAYRMAGILIPPQLARALLGRLNRSGGMISAQGAADILYTLSLQQLLLLPPASASSSRSSSSVFGPTSSILKRRSLGESIHLFTRAGEEERVTWNREGKKLRILVGEDRANEFQDDVLAPSGRGGVYRQLFDSVCTALWEENYTLFDSPSSSPTSENLVFVFWSLVASEQWQWVERLSLPIVEYW